MENPEIKVGDKFFLYDMSRRVYERDENGRAKGGPTFRGHFYEVTIEGETSKSWITNHGRTKVPKSSPFPPLYTEQMISDREWVAVHAYRISEEVRRLTDVDSLKRIAEIVGYTA